MVLTAGSWSYSLLRPLGLNLPVRPVKGYSLTLDTAGIESKPKLGVVDESAHTAITPLGNRIRITGAAEFTGFEDSVHKKRIGYLERMLEQVYPELFSKLDLREGKIWCGFRPMSSDGLPFIGETKIKGLYINSGHGHLGWTLAMGSGALLSDLITGIQPSIDPTPYLASRSL